MEIALQFEMELYSRIVVLISLLIGYIFPFSIILGYFLFLVLIHDVFG